MPAGDLLLYILRRRILMHTLRHAAAFTPLRTNIYASSLAAPFTHYHYFAAHHTQLRVYHHDIAGISHYVTHGGRHATTAPSFRAARVIIINITTPPRRTHYYYRHATPFTHVSPHAHHHCHHHHHRHITPFHALRSGSYCTLFILLRLRRQYAFSQ